MASEVFFEIIFPFYQKSCLHNYGLMQISVTSTRKQPTQLRYPTGWKALTRNNSNRYFGLSILDISLPVCFHFNLTAMAYDVGIMQRRVGMGGCNHVLRIYFKHLLHTLSISCAGNTIHSLIFSSSSSVLPVVCSASSQ